MSKLLTFLTFTLASLLVSAPALAATKSFTAASAALPSDVEVLATSNLKQVRATDTFKRVFPELMKMGGEVGAGIGTIKKQCGIDPVTAFDDATIGLDKHDTGAVFIAMNGVTETKMLECVSKIAKSTTKATVTSKKSGGITEVKNDKSSTALYFAWLPGDVVAIGTRPDDRALLERMLGGKGDLAKSKIGGRVLKADSTVALSFIFGKQVPIDRMTVRTAELSVVAKGGDVRAVATVEMASSKEAEQVAAAANAISAFMNVPRSAPKELERIMKSLDAKASGSEAKIKAESTEKDLGVVLQWAIKELVRF